MAKRTVTPLQAERFGKLLARFQRAQMALGAAQEEYARTGLALQAYRRELGIGDAHGIVNDEGPLYAHVVDEKGNAVDAPEPPAPAVAAPGEVSPASSPPAVDPPAAN